MGAERAMLEAADRAGVKRSICVKRNNIDAAREKLSHEWSTMPWRQSK